MRLVFVLPLIGAIIGSLIILLTMAASGSAPQEAAGYAMAAAFAVVPYVFAKAIAGLSAERPSKIADRLVEAINATQTATKPTSAEYDRLKS